MKRETSGKTFVVVGAAALVLVLGAAFVAFFGKGRQRFERGSLMTEAHLNVAMLARGVAACAERPDDAGARRNELPPTTRAVPATLGEITREGYASGARADEWDDDAFRCAGFTIGAPLHFQYQWELLSRGHGRAQAVADLDGDGRGDAFLHCPIDCTADPKDGRLKCAIGAVDATPWQRGVPVAPRVFNDATL